MTFKNLDLARHHIEDCSLEDKRIIYEELNVLFGKKQKKGSSKNDLIPTTEKAREILHEQARIKDGRVGAVIIAGILGFKNIRQVTNFNSVFRLCKAIGAVKLPQNAYVASIVWDLLSFISDRGLTLSELSILIDPSSKVQEGVNKVPFNQNIRDEVESLGENLDVSYYPFFSTGMSVSPAGRTPDEPLDLERKEIIEMADEQYQDLLKSSPNEFNEDMKKLIKNMPSEGDFSDEPL